MSTILSVLRDGVMQLSRLSAVAGPAGPAGPAGADGAAGPAGPNRTVITSHWLTFDEPTGPWDYSAPDEYIGLCMPGMGIVRAVRVAGRSEGTHNAANYWRWTVRVWNTVLPGYMLDLGSVTSAAWQGQQFASVTLQFAVTPQLSDDDIVVLSSERVGAPGDVYVSSFLRVRQIEGV